MTSTDRKSICEQTVYKFRDAVFRKHDFAAVQDVLTEDFVDHFAPNYDPDGRDGVGVRFAQAQDAFETERLEVMTSVFEEPVLSQAVKIHFHHVGEFMGLAPTGKRFWIGGSNTFVFQGDRIAEHFGVFDVAKIPDILAPGGSAGWREMWAG